MKIWHLALVLACTAACEGEATVATAGAGGSGGSGANGGSGGGPCEGGAAPCTMDRADCDGCAVNGCEVDLASDATHCGRCGRSCGAQSCGFSVCEPDELAGEDFGPYVYSMVTDDARVYLGQGAEIVAVPKAGGNATLLASGPEIAGIAVRDDLVFWSGLFTGEIVVAPLGGGPVTTLGTTPTGFLNGVAVDDTSVYVSCHDMAGYLAKVPRSGGSAEVLHGGGAHFNTRIDDGYVYYSSAEVGRIGKDGSGAIELTSGVGPTLIAIDTTHVYYVGPFGIARVLKEGGGSETVVGDQADVTALEVDAERVYWRQVGTGDIYEAAKDGSALLKIAANQVYELAGGFAIDDAFVYWIGPANHLYRTPK